MVYVGLALVVVAGVLLYLVRSRRARLQAITATQTSTARELADLAGSVGRELGEVGRFRQVAEVKGLVRCDSPLTSDLAKQPCVHFAATVTREYEETYWEMDAQRNQVSRTRRGSQTMASNVQSVPFWVEDATGRIQVLPEGAKVDATQAVDRFEPGEAGQLGGVISIGGVSIGGLTIGPAAGSRTLGYRYRESIVPLDRRLYVLGEASDSSGVLAVQKPAEPGHPFIISVKTEEELVQAGSRTIRWLQVGAFAGGAVGIVLIAVGLLR